MAYKSKIHGARQQHNTRATASDLPAKPQGLHPGNVLHIHIVVAINSELRHVRHGINWRSLLYKQITRLAFFCNVSMRFHGTSPFRSSMFLECAEADALAEASTAAVDTQNIFLNAERVSGSMHSLFTHARILCECSGRRLVHRIPAASARRSRCMAHSSPTTVNSVLICRTRIGSARWWSTCALQLHQNGHSNHSHECAPYTCSPGLAPCMPWPSQFKFEPPYRYRTAVEGCVVRFESRIHCCLNHAHSWRQQWNAANASGKQVQSRLTVQRTAVRASHAVQPCCRAQYSRAVARSSRRSAAIASSISYACIDAYSCNCTVCGTWSVCATADACGTNCHTLMPV